MKRVPLILILLLPVGGPRADGVLRLEEAIAVALQRNRHLSAAEAGREAAAAGAQEARAGRLPRFGVAEVASRSTNPVMVFDNLLGQEAFGPANFDPAFLNEPDPLTNFTSRLVVTQPVWAGGRLRAQARAAREGSAAADLLTRRTRQQVRHQVVAAYSDAVLAGARQRVATEALATARAHVALAEDLRAAGLVVASDVLSAQVRASEIEEMLAAAAGEVQVSYAALNAVMGLPQSAPVALPDALPEPEAGQEADLEALLAEAREGRLDGQAGEREVARAAWQARAARAGHRPQVDLVAMYEANHDSYPGADGTNWTVMASVGLTLFDGGATRAQVRRGLAEAKARERMQEQLHEEIALEVRRAWADGATARARLEQARGAAGLARESLRMVEDRYREGLAPLVELLDAETARTRARAREVEALRDLVVASSALELAVGRP